MNIQNSNQVNFKAKFCLDDKAKVLTRWEVQRLNNIGKIFEKMSNQLAGTFTLQTTNDVTTSLTGTVERGAFVEGGEMSNASLRKMLVKYSDTIIAGKFKKIQKLANITNKNWNNIVSFLMVFDKAITSKSVIEILDYVTHLLNDLRKKSILQDKFLSKNLENWYNKKL